MTGTLTCGICAGPLTLRYSGGAPSLVSEAFAPSCHSLSGYGDLYACALCGTIQQPDLPKGRELHELYRHMRDDAYLIEEAGRRRTARRMLDAVERHGARGRMLDVGCGHGLLLDEARARGWQVVGLEISAASRAHASEDLGLDVRDATLDELDPAADGGFDAIVLADVLEHLDDPVAALTQIAGLLAPGGVVCVVTPDPSSLTARLAGRRWWATCARTPTSSHGRPWLSCCAPRGSSPSSRSSCAARSHSAAGSAGSASAPARSPARSRPSAGSGSPAAHLTMALGDERVVVARR